MSGGDYYDIFQVNAHKFALIVGDVAGKGVSRRFPYGRDERGLSKLRTDAHEAR